MSGKHARFRAGCGEAKGRKWWRTFILAREAGKVAIRARERAGEGDWWSAWALGLSGHGAKGLRVKHAGCTHATRFALRYVETETDVERRRGNELRGLDLPARDAWRMSLGMDTSSLKQTRADHTGKGSYISIWQARGSCSPYRDVENRFDATHCSEIAEST